MTEENLKPEGQPEGTPPEETPGTDSQGDGLTLENLNKTLGKEFKDIDTALKSLKETQDFVGEKGQKLSEAEAKLAKAEEGKEEAKTQAERLESLEKTNKLIADFFKQTLIS